MTSILEVSGSSIGRDNHNLEKGFRFCLGAAEKGIDVTSIRSSFLPLNPFIVIIRY
jgi:hypothetical protein